MEEEYQLKAELARYTEMERSLRSELARDLQDLEGDSNDEQEPKKSSNDNAVAATTKKQTANGSGSSSDSSSVPSEGNQQENQDEVDEMTRGGSVLIQKK